MTPEEFVIWLNGFYSASDTSHLTKKQSDIVKRMLSEVTFDGYIEHDSEVKDMPSQSIWETSSTAHSSITSMVIEYREY
jgi:hypothetical protein